jgi:hypothetical protein
MPDTIRITGGSFRAHPGRSGFGTAIAATLCVMMATAQACAQAAVEGAIDVSTIGLYVLAVSRLDRHEAAALALTLGILCLRSLPP